VDYPEKQDESKRHQLVDVKRITEHYSEQKQLENLLLAFLNQELKIRSVLERLTLDSLGLISPKKRSISKLVMFVSKTTRKFRKMTRFSFDVVRAIKTSSMNFLFWISLKTR
jgi:hypothetical protein